MNSESTRRLFLLSLAVRDSSHRNTSYRSDQFPSWNRMGWHCSIKCYPPALFEEFNCCPQASSISMTDSFDSVWSRRLTFSSAPLKTHSVWIQRSSPAWKLQWNPQLVCLNTSSTSTH